MSLGGDQAAPSPDTWALAEYYLFWSCVNYQLSIADNNPRCGQETDDSLQEQDDLAETVSYPSKRASHIRG